MNFVIIFLSCCSNGRSLACEFYWMRAAGKRRKSQREKGERARDCSLSLLGVFSPRRLVCVAFFGNIPVFFIPILIPNVA